MKILKKERLTAEDLGNAKREIEILKLCQHPNIIRLRDVFENPDYIYIVMEYLRGGDLYDYLKKREFKVSSERARVIIHSLATAIYYLQSFGIVHRDIKPDNILMVDESDDSDVKIVDFGLSKMIGPNEYCSDPFGTFGYVAPEVLLGKPYDKSIDIWGLGVMLFIMLSGEHPFDNAYEKLSDQAIAKYSLNLIYRNTVYKEPDFSTEGWSNVSPPAKAFVACIHLLIIIAMLVKQASKRINIEQMLLDRWLTKDCKDVRALRKKATRADAFRLFSLVQPKSLKIFDEVQLHVTVKPS